MQQSASILDQLVAQAALCPCDGRARLAELAASANAVLSNGPEIEVLLTVKIEVFLRVTAAVVRLGRTG
jgi:hypothetical protein